MCRLRVLHRVSGMQDPDPQGQLVTRSRSRFPGRPHVCASHKVDAREYMEDDGALYKTLRKVNRVGVVLLENAGVEEGTVLDLARRVAPVSHHTLYGDMFDVVSQVRHTPG